MSSYNNNKQPNLIDICAIKESSLKSKSTYYAFQTNPNKKIFISYSHKDEECKELLSIHLSTSAKQNNFEIWDDQRIETGNEWNQEILKELEKSHMAILLISVHFLNSEFIQKIELPKIKELHKKNNLIIYPIIIQPCLWQNDPWIKNKQVQPRCGFVLSSFKEDELQKKIVDIVEDIQTILLKDHYHVKDRIGNKDNKRLIIAITFGISLSVLFLIVTSMPDIAVLKNYFIQSNSLQTEIKDQITPILLRSSSTVLTYHDVKTMIKKYNFFDNKLNPEGNFANYFVKNQDNGIVFDRRTGLMWQQTGLKIFLMSYDDAIKHIQEINQIKLAGYSDWRLPTLEELSSLLENRKLNEGIYIDSVFDPKFILCWTSDRWSTGGRWLVNFHYGQIYWNKLDRGYVRVVRSSSSF